MTASSGIDNRQTGESGGPFISKSKYLSGLQCHKLLWHAYNAKHLIAEPDAQQQAVFDQGHQVGALARQLFPGGIEVGQGIEDFDAILAASTQAVKQRRPLYETAFAFNGGYARADILNPVAGDAWELIEVKSTASVKDIHLHDLAFQAYVYSGAGLQIRRCILAHINLDFIKHGPIDPHEFFVLEDVTSQVSELSRSIEDKLDEMFGTIRLPEYPQVRIGPQCGDPYPCPLIDLCWGHLAEDSVTNLYRGKAKGFKLLDTGITRLGDIPDDFRLTANQSIQRLAARTGQPHIDKAALSKFLSRTKYPVFFLDFETFSTAIPLFDGLRPCQQVPFQYSLHIVRAEGAAPKHHSFLADGKSDPRPEFIERLRAQLEDNGSIIAYNAPFELGRLKECCELSPDMKPWLARIRKRVVDLLVPFRAFSYYHPAQNGSASMKAVLPALTGRGYDHLAIQEGGAASTEYMRAHFGDVPDEERQRVRRQLEEYCGLDTMGIVWIVDALRG